jgi:hypothetical protein
MDDRKVTRPAAGGAKAGAGGVSSAADRSGSGARPPAPTPPLSNSEKKAIEQGKAAVVDGKLVESNVGKVEGRS